MKIGVLSDTHGYLDPEIKTYFKACDEIWHLGDIGTIDVLQTLMNFKETRAVYGNIDGQEIRTVTKEYLYFEVEGCKVLLIHIGGYPGRYQQRARELIERVKPDLYLCGHSHILKVIRDKKYGLLHMNPGACGIHGFHQVRTLLRFDITDKKISQVEVIELGVRG